MKYSGNLQALRKSLSIKENEKGLRHTINQKSPILPFPTRNPERAKFKEGFHGVTGEFARIVSGNIVREDISIENIIKKITRKVDLEDEDIPYFEKLVRSFLTDDLKSMKIFHPHILQYLPLASGNEAKGERDIALFIRDVLLENPKILADFFAKSDASNLLVKLILEQLNNLETKETKQRFHPLLPMITEVFQEDVEFLVKHRDYFINHIHLFLAYYYFFYITQVTLKLNQTHNAKWDELTEVVYTLDWESTSKTRPSYNRGYRSIKEAARNLLVHVNCLEHLNFIFDTTEAKPYPHLKEIVDELPEESQFELVKTLKEWIAEYRYHTSLPEVEIDDDEYQNLVKELFSSLNDGIQAGPKSRYALSIEEIGKRYFLKTRGSLGYMLNITQDFLLLLTAISVKNERMSLKEVFSQFERRGVFLDRHSKEAVVELFDKINILDKKSDSGDAQYVKPIL